MALQCGIVGLPNVGKSTLFNCLSNAKAQSANFPFCTIAGLVQGASKGEGLGNKFLANIRETDAILHVLRCFDDENVTHVHNTVDPVRDKEIIDYELQLKDLETVESRIAKTQKQAQTGGDKVAKMQYEVLKKYQEALLQGKPARTVSLETVDEQKFGRELFLLTAWTFMRGSKAPQCAGVIHTDFEKGFIRAEVIKYDDYVALGSESAVREAGKMAIEGKNYVAQDGDIMHFLFNV